MGYASQHYSVPVPSQDKWGRLWQKGHLAQKWGNDGGGGTDSPDGAASRRTVHASASVIFHCTIRSRRWRAIMEEVDKGCSEFCITVGTVTRTASILIHSRLQELAVSLSRLSSRLWLYAGLIGFNHPCWLKANFVVCAKSFFFFSQV